MKNHLIKNNSDISIAQSNENIVGVVFTEATKSEDSLFSNNVNWFNEWVNGVWVSGVRLD